MSYDRKSNLKLPPTRAARAGAPGWTLNCSTLTADAHCLSKNTSTLEFVFAFKLRYLIVVFFLEH